MKGMSDSCKYFISLSLLKHCAASCRLAFLSFYRLCSNYLLFCFAMIIYIVHGSFETPKNGLSRVTVTRSQLETEKLITWLYRNDYFYLHQLTLSNVGVGPKRPTVFVKLFHSLITCLKMTRF
jgi:hypothetical protein